MLDLLWVPLLMPLAMILAVVLLGRVERLATRSEAPRVTRAHPRDQEHPEPAPVTADLADGTSPSPSEASPAPAPHGPARWWTSARAVHPRGHVVRS